MTPSLRRAVLALCCGTAVSLTGCQSAKVFSQSKEDPQASFKEELALALQQDRKLPSGGPASAAATSPGAGNVSRLIQNGDQALSEHAQNPARLAEARNQFEEVLRIDPNNAVAHHRLAVIGDLAHNFGDAEKHYAQALRANPNDAQLLHDIGYSYMLQEKPGEAIPYLKRSLEVSPGFDMAARKLADAYVRTRQTELAQQTLSQVMPSAQVGAEIERLQAAHDPARKPSLFGRMRDLRPEEAAPDSPTQQLMAELEHARVEAERARLDKQQAQVAQQQMAADGWPQRPPVHDSQISQVMAAMDQQSRPPVGQPIYLDPGRPGATPYTDPRQLAAGPNAWGQPVPNTTGYGPADNDPVSGPMAGGQVPSQAGPGPSAMQTASDSRAQYNDPGFQYAEVIRGTQRGSASPDAAYLAQQQRPSAPWGVQGQPQPASATSGIDMVGGRYTPGSLSDRAQNSMGGAVESANYSFNSPAMAQPNGAYGPNGAYRLPSSNDVATGLARPSTAPGAPATDDYQAAAALGMGVGPGQMFPVIRRADVSSPGAGSVWNGTQLPQAGRQLPTDRPISDLSKPFNQPGQPSGMNGAMVTGPNSLGQQMPSGGQYYTAPNQFAGGPNNAPPQTPQQQWTASAFQMQPGSPGTNYGLQGYDQMRTQADSQRNAVIQQVQGQYPSSMMSTPSYGLPVERPDQGASQMNSWYDRSINAPANQRTVVTPQAYPSSPQPVQPANAPLNPQIAPQTNFTSPASQLPPPQYGQNIVVPPVYSGSSPTNWQTTPSGSPTAGSGGGYTGPMIIPGK
ncbi:MAG: tetratricopeptide repeat protein [Planctomycetaceae bacterium]